MTQMFDDDLDPVWDMFGVGPKGDGVKPTVQALQPSPVKGPTERRFEAFHNANPHVYKAIVDIARDLKQRGFEKCSIRLIYNRLRWLYAIQTVGGDFKLNNNYSGYYSRVVMVTVPALNGFFETRIRKGATPYDPDLKALGFAP